jgi:hypothetical protein
MAAQRVAARPRKKVRVMADIVAFGWRGPQTALRFAVERGRID